MKLLSFQKLLFFIKPCIFCDLEQQHTKTRNLLKKAVNSFSYKKSKKISKQLFVSVLPFKIVRSETPQKQKNSRILMPFDLIWQGKVRHPQAWPWLPFGMFSPNQFFLKHQHFTQKISRIFKTWDASPPDPHQYAYASLKDTPQTVTN